MKLRKYISTGMIVTFMAAGYVHQRVEIVKSCYELQKSQKYLSSLVDQNSKLTYNLSKLESPRNLLASLSGEEIEFASHRLAQKGGYQLAGTADGRVPDSGFAERFWDLIYVDAEAGPRE